MSHIKDIFKRSRKSSSAKKSDDASNSDKANASDNASIADDADVISIADTATLAPSIVGASTSARPSARPTDMSSKKKEPKDKDTKKHTNFIARAGNLYNSSPSLRTELGGIDPTAG
ncbi:hypothetical protein IW136_005067, partial [Coemansia sp. RSA 678]